MLEKLKLHIDDQLPFLKGKKLLVACSGGVDSVSLAYLLTDLGYDIALAHCNFSLRGSESDEDENFVVNLADILSITVFTETFDTKDFAFRNKISTQMAARDLRYQWFAEIVKDFKFDYILTGHQADDDLETFFINLSRGTGIRGLTGIPEINGNIVRPLLSFSRNEILDYAKNKKLYWREDSSNKKSDYLRNKVRLEVLPKYKELGESVITSFQRTQDYLRTSQSLINDYMVLISNLVVSELNGGGYKIDIKKLRDLPNTPALLYELLFQFEFTAWDDIYALLDAQSGKQIFSTHYRLLKDRDTLLITKIATEWNPDEILISESDKKISEPITLEFNSTEKVGYIDNTTIYVDKDRLRFPMRIRKWAEGDSFQPFGMKGKKKLSKFFKDEKLSLLAKEKIWVLLSGSTIVWVIGMRADDRFKVTADTKRILKITRIP